MANDKDVKGAGKLEMTKSRDHPGVQGTKTFLKNKKGKKKKRKSFLLLHSKTFHQAVTQICANYEHTNTIQDTQ